MAELKSGFLIDDKHYPCPTLDSINLDEERILFLYADTVVNDFMPQHPEASEEERAAWQRAQNQKYRDPDFKRALAHIAYRREHRDLSDQEIQELMGDKVNALQGNLAMMLAGDEEDPTKDSPKLPESESEPLEPSPPSSSGSPTPKSSDPVDASPEVTGTSESDTSSPATPPIALVS